ncbi:MAG: hypothetical protein II513_04300 [Ruminococcus sp.]|nr:hypothetical protein [Ruminococcus sp.]
MKARVPVFRTAKEKRAIEDELHNEWRKLEQRKTREMAERILKVFLCVLVEDYHFGRKRGREFYERCGNMLAEADDNPVFWEQRDRICIDYLGIVEFGRDYTYHGKAVREEDLEVSEE